LGLYPLHAVGRRCFGIRKRLAHFIGVALSRSLGSGASSAYLYEYLRRFDAVTEYKRAEGNARAYGLLGKVVCWAGIGLMMQWHVTLPYWLTALSAVVAVIFAFWMPALSKINGAEAASEGTAGGVECLKKEHSARLAVFRVLWGSPFLVLLMFQGAAIFVLARIGQVNLFQPILAEKTFGLPAYGVVMSMMTVFEALGSLRHQDLRKWLNDLNAIFVLSISAALSLGLIPFVDKVGAVILLCLLAWSSGVAFPMQRQLINDAIMDSRFRATLLSMESILDRAICSIVAWLLGWYLGFGSLDDFLIISALIITGVMVVLAGILFTAPRLKLTRSKVTSVP
jgi:hypothetical protein